MFEPKSKPVAILCILPMAICGQATSGPAAKRKVLAAAYHEFPHVMPGKILKSEKIWDSAAGLVRYHSDDPDIKTASALQDLYKENQRLEFRKHGALSGPMRRIYRDMRDGDKARVIVVLKYPSDIAHPSKLEHSEDVLIRHSQNLLTLQPVVGIDQLASKHGMGKPIRLDKNRGLYEITKSQLSEIIFDPSIAAIEEYRESRPQSKGIPILPYFFGQGANPGLATLARSAYNHSNSPLPAGFGSQVKAATLEVGMDQGFLSCIGVNPVYWETVHLDVTDFQRFHSKLTFLTLARSAPNARFYHHAQPWYGGSFIKTHGIQTSSLSMGRTPAIPYADRTTTAGEYIEVDEMAYVYPYPVITTPTGNYGWTWEAEWHLYNAISVGNVHHQNQSTFRINTCPVSAPAVSYGCTQTRNPYPKYGTSCLRPPDSRYPYCSSDREMPYIVAPGTTPAFDASTCSSQPMNEGCFPGEGVWCGTSLSAPVANGMTAGLIAASSSMVSWPEKVRAALLLTAENVDGGEWNATQVDGLDGAGVINGAAAVDFAKTHTAKGPNQSAVAKGMGIGQISHSTWNSPLVYNIAVPSPIPSGKILRIVLTWDSNPYVPPQTAPEPVVNELSDLDLSASSNLASRFSGSYNGNVEIVHFQPSEVQAGATVQATIQKYLKRIPAGGPQYFYYAIAWDWVDAHAP